MSSDNSTIVENNGFIERFIEVCETDKPVEIKRLLNISDQAARNYLAGRFPTPEILITIAEQTPFSIHWLLTGDGKKFVDSAYEKHTRVLSDEMRLAIREECIAVFSQLQHEAQPKVVTITPDRVKTEKVIEAPVNTSKKVL
jgi:hypothetical protein